MSDLPFHRFLPGRSESSRDLIINEDHLIKVKSSESLFSCFLSSLMHLYVKADYCLNELEVYSQDLYKSRIDEM